MWVYKLISFVFHPLLMSFIGTLLYLYLSPTYILRQQELVLLAIVFASTYLIPVVLLILLKRVNLIFDFHLRSIEERRFPILFFILLSFLIGRTVYNIHIADLLAFSFFGVAFGLSFTYLIFNLRIKTSLHTLGIGGLIGFVIIMSYEFQLNFNALLAGLFILAGMIAMSRLALNAHNNREVYLGFVLGLVSQFMSYQVYQNM